jgi:hypothetical protein
VEEEEERVFIRTNEFTLINKLCRSTVSHFVRVILGAVRFYVEFCQCHEFHFT